MTEEAVMKTYVAEINGEAIMAFRASSDDDADELVNGEDSEKGGIKTVLMEYDRADGGLIWNGVTEIIARRANALEDARWRRARDAATGDATEGAPIDPETGDDPDDFNAFLIPISDPDESEEGSS